MKNAKLLLMLCSIVVMLAIPIGNTNAAPNIGDVDTGNTEESPKSSYGDILFYENFEGDLSKWQDVNGLWHLTDKMSYSETHSMWFGDENTGTYETGNREFGAIVSEEIDLSGQDEAYLIFYHWRQTEEEPNYDNASIGIGGDPFFFEIWDSGDNKNIYSWEKVTINISIYCGSSNTVQISFYFDTINKFANDFRGWLLDDIIVTNDLDNDEDNDDDDDDNDDDDGNGNSHKKSEAGIGVSVVSFLLSPIGLIIVGGITAALVAVVIVVWIIKKKIRR